MDAQPHQNINPSSSVAAMPPTNYTPIIFETTEELELEELAEFAETFHQQRILLGFRQCEVGPWIGKLNGKYMDQATISRFENLQMSFHTMCELKPWLQKWLEDMRKSLNIPPSMSTMSIYHITPRKRQKRTSFQTEVRDALEKAFSQNSKPSNQEIANLVQNLGIDTQVVKNWFTNRRGKEKKMKTEQQQTRKARTFIGGSARFILEEAFNKKSYQTPEDIGILSESLAMDKKIVQCWFQNRRKCEKRRNPPINSNVAY